MLCDVGSIAIIFKNIENIELNVEAKCYWYIIYINYNNTPLHNPKLKPISNKDI